MWFILYVWFSIGAFDVALSKVVPLVLDKISQCEKKPNYPLSPYWKDKYKVFDSGNLVSDGISWTQAEDLCKTTTTCSNCFLPEPKNDTQNDNLLKLAKHCSIDQPFLGLLTKWNKKQWRWRSDKKTAKLKNKIKCDKWEFIEKKSNDTCVQVIDDERCKINCDIPRARNFICESFPSKSSSTQIQTSEPQVSTEQEPQLSTEPISATSSQPRTTEPESAETSAEEDLPVLTIVGIVVGCLVGLIGLARLRS